MIEEKTECKRLGYEYKDLFAKLVWFIHHVPFAKDYINNNELKMLSDLDLFLNTGKYEIIEFGTKKTRFDSTDIIASQKEEIERLNNIINELEKSWKEQQEYYRYRKDNRYRSFLSKNLDKLKELKENNK